MSASRQTLLLMWSESRRAKARAESGGALQYSCEGLLLRRKERRGQSCFNQSGDVCAKDQQYFESHNPLVLVVPGGTLLYSPQVAPTALEGEVRTELL
ncbi:hypothetical protein NDU88_002178 [Pleurodeles waltl]|uniref:Uncharacterized protein n=1 Tax=Pleurodeles waltl TaxID=8319 RepID=A0AAV7MNV2_PLEWA|nr:hypothetical protein NDU88_002178 [Pleurodeles waltl]